MILRGAKSLKHIAKFPDKTFFQRCVLSDSFSNSDTSLIVFNGGFIWVVTMPNSGWRSSANRNLVLFSDIRKLVPLILHPFEYMSITNAPNDLIGFDL